MHPHPAKLMSAGFAYVRVRFPKHNHTVKAAYVLGHLELKSKAVLRYLFCKEPVEFRKNQNISKFVKRGVI